MARKKNPVGNSTPQIPSTNYSNFYTVTTNNTGSSPLQFVQTNTGNYSINTTPNPSNSLHVKGDVEIEGNLKLQGHDLAKLLNKIENRLAILMEPDEEKLRQFPALKKAYDQYKVLDALVSSDKKGE